MLAAPATLRRADYSNHAIRFVNIAGLISTVAGGLLGTGGFAGDGLPATSSVVRLSSPMGIVYQDGGGLVVSGVGAPCPPVLDCMSPILYIVVERTGRRLHPLHVSSRSHIYE